MNKQELTQLGNKIRAIRLQLGLTMDEFISKIDGKNLTGRSGTVNNWESGKNAPNKKRLAKIAELGGITVNNLLDTEFGTARTPKINKQLVAKKIQQIIKDKKITPKEFGETLNPPVSENTVLQWENNESLPHGYYSQIAKLYGIDLMPFLTGLSDQELKLNNSLSDLAYIEAELEEQQTDKQDALEDISQSLYEFNQFIEYLQKKEDFETLYFLTDFMEMAEKAKGWTYDPKRQ